MIEWFFFFTNAWVGSHAHGPNGWIAPPFPTNPILLSYVATLGYVVAYDGVYAHACECHDA